ncbi:MAG: NUDIX hydrolase [Bacteroidota bacterium]|nr:NUDIX hydrolase [Bacteroidota bacterium]
MEPSLLLSYIKRIQAIAQAGIAYAEIDYDLERYEELRSITLEMMHALTDEPIERLTKLFTNETGYQTPKVDIRAVIFKDDKILMVRENHDKCWSLPGGWADVGFSPGEVALKEVKEEAGIDVVPVRVLAIFDKKCHPHPPSPYHTYKMFILCEYTGGSLQKGMETSDVNYFSINEIPVLSEERITYSQIETLFRLHSHKSVETLFD